MIDLNLAILIITLNEKGLNRKLKEIDRMDKNNISHLYVIYKKLACAGRLKVQG